MSAGSSRRFGELVDALADAAKRLQDCRIVLRAGDGALADNAAELARRGVDIGRQLRKLTNTHTKGIVVDGQRVLVGSHNWSMSGVTANRDASLLFDDPEIAAYYGAVFEVDWTRAKPLVAPGPERPVARLAAGPRRLQGSVVFRWRTTWRPESLCQRKRRDERSGSGGADAGREARCAGDRPCQPRGSGGDARSRQRGSGSGSGHARHSSDAHPRVVYKLGAKISPHGAVPGRDFTAWIAAASSAS
jgi:hypothetical protein